MSHLFKHQAHCPKYCSTVTGMNLLLTVVCAGWAQYVALIRAQSSA